MTTATKAEKLQRNNLRVSRPNDILKVGPAVVHAGHNRPGQPESKLYTACGWIITDDGKTPASADVTCPDCRKALGLKPIRFTAGHAAKVEAAVEEAFATLVTENPADPLVQVNSLDVKRLTDRITAILTGKRGATH